MPTPSRSDSLNKIHYHHLVATLQNCRNRVLFYSCIGLLYKYLQKQHILVVYDSIGDTKSPNAKNHKQESKSKLVF